MIRDDNTVVFVDFGIFGELSSYEAGYLRRFVEAVAIGNIAQAVHQYMKQLTPTTETDERAFRNVSPVQIFRRWYEASRNAERSSVVDRRLGRYSVEVMEQARRYHLRMGMNTVLFWRAMDALDSSALRCPGYFDLIGTMREFFEPKPSDVIRQVVDMGLDPERAVALASLASRESGPGHENDHGADRAAARLVGRLGGVRAEFHFQDPRARLLSAGLVGLSLLLLGLGAGRRRRARGRARNRVAACDLDRGSGESAMSRPADALGQPPSGIASAGVEPASVQAGRSAARGPGSVPNVAGVSRPDLHQDRPVSGPAPRPDPPGVQRRADGPVRSGPAVPLGAGPCDYHGRAWRPAGDDLRRDRPGPGRGRVASTGPPGSPRRRHRSDRQDPAAGHPSAGAARSPPRSRPGSTAGTRPGRAGDHPAADRGRGDDLADAGARFRA